MDSRNQQALDIVKKHALWSLGAGAVPVPVLDLLALTGIQLDMIKQLCDLYGIDYNENAGKSWLGTLTAGVGTRLAVVRLTKLIPGVGSLVGSSVAAGLSGATTWAVGSVLITQLENGHALSTDALGKQARKQFQDAVDTAREQLRKMKRITNRKASLVSKVRELAEMHADGALTDDEFSRAKARLLRNGPSASSQAWERG